MSSCSANALSAAESGCLGMSNCARSPVCARAAVETDSANVAASALERNALTMPLYSVVLRPCGCFIDFFPGGGYPRPFGRPYGQWTARAGKPLFGFGLGARSFWNESRVGASALLSSPGALPPTEERDRRLLDRKRKRLNSRH